jgi:hypothetical protein
VNTVMNPWVPQKAGKLFTSWRLVSFSGTSLFHGAIIRTNVGQEDFILMTFNRS